MSLTDLTPDGVCPACRIALFCFQRAFSASGILDAGLNMMRLSWIANRFSNFFALFSEKGGLRRGKGGAGTRALPTFRAPNLLSGMRENRREGRMGLEIAGILRPGNRRFKPREEKVILPCLFHARARGRIFFSKRYFHQWRDAENGLNYVSVTDLLSTGSILYLRSRIFCAFPCSIPATYGTDLLRSVLQLAELTESGVYILPVNVSTKGTRVDLGHPFKRAVCFL